jgi:hypothetical protein
MRSAIVASWILAAALVSGGAFAAPPKAASGPVAQNDSPAAAPATPAAPAHDPPNLEEARSRYKRGIEMYNDGDYKLALIEFERSYELAPNWKILYNIGQVHFQLNNYGKALKALERYLKEGATEIPEKRRSDVERDIEGLKSRTAQLTVTANQAGAEVSVDDVVVGKTPLPGEFLVDAGDHRVTLSKAGFKPVTKRVTLAGKDHVSLNLALEKEQGPLVVVQQAPESKPSYVWIGWAATGAITAGAVVTGVLALDANSKLNSLKGTKDVSPTDLHDQQVKKNNLALATDILTGAAVVAGGVSLYFTLTSGKRTEAREPGPQVRAGVGLGSVHLSGVF